MCGWMWMCFSTGAVQGSLRWALYFIRFSFAWYMTRNEYVLDIVLLPANLKLRILPKLPCPVASNSAPIGCHRPQEKDANQKLFAALKSLTNAAVCRARAWDHVIGGGSRGTERHTPHFPWGAQPAPGKRRSLFNEDRGILCLAKPKSSTSWFLKWVVTAFLLYRAVLVL